METNVISQNTLKGKTVVITGGSSGVGRAVAEAFALEGCNIVVAARGKEGLDETVQLCRDLEVAATGVQTDVTDLQQVKDLAEKALQYNGRIDIWVNNAGVMASGKFEDIPSEVNEQVLKTNLFGYMNGAYTVLPIFKNQQEGILINNVSIGAFMPAPYSAAYSASKFGIKGLMDGLRGEISNLPNIHICNVYPQIQKSTGNSHSAKYSGLDFKIPPFAADPRDTAQEFVKLAKHPKYHKFPDWTSFFMKSIYGLFPGLVSSTTNAGMRLMMKMSTADSAPGNIFIPSNEPHRIYGETMLPEVSRKTKTSIALAVGLGIGYLLLTPRKKNKKKKS